MVGYKGVARNIIKLKYACPVNDRTLRPTKPKEPVKVTKIMINNKLDYTCGIPDDVIYARFAKAVENAIAIKKLKGHPIAMYDKEQKRAYIQYPDGRKVYIQSVFSNEKHDNTSLEAMPILFSK